MTWSSWPVTDSALGVPARAVFRGGALCPHARAASARLPQALSTRATRSGLELLAEGTAERVVRC